MSGADDQNNSGQSDYSEHIYGRGKGTHFSSEELFAYLHQPNRNDGVWKVMHQHMLSCPECRQQVAELEQSEYILRTTLGSANRMSYPSITTPVMDRIYGLKETGVRHGTLRAGRVLVVSVALAAIVLFAITFGSTLLARQSTKLASVKPSATVTQTIGVIPQLPTPMPTMKPTLKSSPSVGATVVPQGITLLECTTNLDEVKQHLRICGSNFKAGDNIVFTLVDSKNRPMKVIGPIQVQSDGTFSQNISIHSCKDVPSVIYAQDTSIKNSEVYTTLTGIWYGNC